MSLVPSRPVSRPARLLLAAALLVLPAILPAVGGEPETLSLGYLPCSAGLEPPEFEGGDSEFEFGDVNGDGYLDIVSVGDHGNPLINTDQQGILVWLGDGDCGWTHVRHGHLGYGGVALGDVNGDGLMDVGYGIHHDYSGVDLGDQILEVALGDGSGGFWTAWDDGLAVHGESWGLFSSDFADVDGDGDLDIGSMGFGSSAGLQVYLNQGDGSWLRSFGFIEGNSGHALEFGDVNGDGHPDFATAKQEGAVWVNDGEGFFLQSDDNLPPTSSFGYHKGPALGDVDGDGRDDLAYCDQSTGNPRVWLYRGGAETWLDATANLPDTVTCRYAQLHDMDGDGLVDLSVYGDNQVRVFGGNGLGTLWTPLAQLTPGAAPGDASAFRVGGDVDHNGRPDLVLLSDEGSWPSYRNHMRAFREGTPATALEVRLVHPGPARRLLAGSVGFIDWAASVPPGQSATVTLELSASGPDGPWTTIATAIPNSGRLQWTVPAALSESCVLRATVTSSAEAQAQALGPTFTIARRPEPLTLLVAGDGTVSWTDELGRDRFHLYRGDWERFLSTGEYTQDPAAVPAAARFCDLVSPVQDDSYTPAPGALAFYLVTGYRLAEDNQTPGVPVPMAEGTLGQGSDTSTRRNGSPCPRSSR
jgi:hypothetical protein